MEKISNIEHVASLFADAARAKIMISLMDGRALTPSELTAACGLTKQTISSHIAKLYDANLIKKRKQGRFHYLYIDNQEVAETVEALLRLTQIANPPKIRIGPKDEKLRTARICYDHLAGEAGVFMFDRISQICNLNFENFNCDVTNKNFISLLSKIGISELEFVKSKSPKCKSCLDWSERKSHLAGSLGRLILERLIMLNWCQKKENSRVIEFSIQGKMNFEKWLDI